MLATPAGCFPSSYTSIYKISYIHTHGQNVAIYLCKLQTERNHWSRLRWDNGNFQPVGSVFPYVLHAMSAVFQSHEREQALMF